MKLGEALLKKDEYIKRQENIKKRIKSNVVLRDDNENNENPNDLIKEYIDVNNELSDLIVKITNKEHETKLELPDKLNFLTKVDYRKYGDTSISFYRSEEE